MTTPTSRRRRRPTQADVAKLAGVSVPLVSAVTSGSPGSKSIGASEATRERIWEAVRSLGYVPNVAARNLAGGTNKLISVFTYEALLPGDSKNLYHDQFVGIEKEADALGYNLLLLSSTRRADGSRAIYAEDSNSLQLADGAIIFGQHGNTDELARLAREDFPFVHIGRPEIPGVEVSTVTADYAEATHRATLALADLGHVRIGYGATGLDNEPARDRRAGFDRAVAEIGLDDDQTPTLPTRGGDDLLALIAEHRLTAIIMETAYETIDLRTEAARRGITIPDDLSVIALDNRTIRSRNPRIARVVVPRREMGRHSVRALIDLLEGSRPAPIQEALPCDLRLEHTVAPPPQ